MSKKTHTRSKYEGDAEAQVKKPKHAILSGKNGEPTSYSLEIAARADTELLAINKLKDLGLSRADQVKTGDIDQQAGLYILKVGSDIDELVNKFYAAVRGNYDVYILSDEASIERSQIIIKESSIVELQIRKLLLYILPETKKVFLDIINNIQKFKTSKNTPTTDIEWCAMISGFTFGELIEVLETDISEVARTSVLSDRGLAELIVSVDGFDEFKSKIQEVSTPKLIWNLVNKIIEKPIEYRHISQKIRELYELRNAASHVQVITPQDVENAVKCRKHIMRYISRVKSNYQVELQGNLKNIAKTMSESLNIAYKINPRIFDNYLKQIQNPLAEVASLYKVDLVNAASIAKLINTNQSAALSLGKMINDQIMANMPHKELEKITSQIASIGFNKYLESSNNEMLKTINMVSNQMANISDKTKDLQVELDGETDR